MTRIVKLRLAGEQHLINIPKDIIRETGLKAGDMMMITAVGCTVTVTKEIQEMSLEDRLKASIKEIKNA